MAPVLQSPSRRMEYLVGALLGLAVPLFGRVVGFDRDRSFYTVVLVVTASYYDLFAIMGGSRHALLGELLGTAAFVVLAALAFRRNLWLVVVGLLAHGVFDLVHGALIDDPGVPPWWPMFCLMFDVAAAGYLARRLLQRSGVAAAPAQPS
jgi:hypothetical protein